MLPQAALALVLGHALTSFAAAEDSGKPRHKHDSPWMHMKLPNPDGASHRAIQGNPWADGDAARKRGERGHEESDVERAVSADRPTAPEQVVPLKGDAMHSLVSHYAHRDAEDAVATQALRAGAPAPGPGPAPGPAPWTEDPEWMVDGARGDKSQTVPIPTNVVRGLATDAAPEQGFHGRPVAHSNLKTALGDWRAEFGPEGPESACGACIKHPDNYWCKAHITELCRGIDLSDPGGGGGGSGGSSAREAGPAFRKTGGASRLAASALVLAMSLCVATRA